MSLLELFCDVDDFMLKFAPQWRASQVAAGKQRDRAGQLCPSEVMIILIHFHQSHFVRVLTLNMVDNSTNPREGISGWLFSSFSPPGRPLHPVARHPICSQLRLRRLCHFAELLLASRALTRQSLGPTAGEHRGLPAPSIAGSFCLLPWRESVAGSVAPDGCPLVLAAARV